MQKGDILGVKKFIRFFLYTSFKKKLFMKFLRPIIFNLIYKSKNVSNICNINSISSKKVLFIQINIALFMATTVPEGDMTGC